MSKQAKKILVVEDEKPIARALELKLNHSGFDTRVVSNGEDALKATQEEEFDIIILDLIMPKMDGFETLTRFKEQKIVAPIIVISNLGQEEDLRRAKELGARGYFIKSDTPIVELVDHIKQMLIS